MRFKINEEVKKAGIEELVKEKINIINDLLNKKLEILSRAKVEVPESIPSLYERTEEYFKEMKKEYQKFSGYWGFEIDINKYNKIFREISCEYTNKLNEYQPQEAKQK